MGLRPRQGSYWEERTRVESTIPITAVVVLVVMGEVGRGVVFAVNAAVWQGGAVDSSLRV